MVQTMPVKTVKKAICFLYPVDLSSSKTFSKSVLG